MCGIVAVECRRVGQRWLTSVLRWPLHLESWEMRRGVGTWPCEGGVRVGVTEGAILTAYIADARR